MPFELRFAQLDRNHTRQTLATVIAGEVLVFLFQQAFFAGIFVDQSGQSCSEAFFVRSTLVGVDGVGVGVDALVVGVSPLHCHLDGKVFLFGLGLKRNYFGVDNLDLFNLVQILDVILQAALIEVAVVAAIAFVVQRNAQALV